MKILTRANFDRSFVTRSNHYVNIKPHVCIISEAGLIFEIIGRFRCYLRKIPMAFECSDCVPVW